MRVEIVHVHRKDIFHGKINEYVPMGGHKDRLRIRYIIAVDETMDSEIHEHILYFSSCLFLAVFS